MNPLTEEQRKLLTEFLGECWHESRGQAIQNKSWYCTCMTGRVSGYNEKEYLLEHISKSNSRTFDTGNDLLDLKEALVKKGLWYDFLIYTFRDLEQFIAYGNDGYTDDGIAWLIDKDRFPELVAEFMEVKK